MEWLSHHRFAVVLLGACMILIVGAVVFDQRAHPISAQAPIAWTSGEALLNPGISSEENLPTAPGNTTAATSAAAYTPIPIYTAAANSAAQASPAPLSSNSSATAQTQANSPENWFIPQGYEYVPGGLISISTSSSSLSPSQQALYEYGNAAGAIIQSFEAAHPDTSTTDTLSTWINDRSNAADASAVVSLGDSLEQMGAQIAAISSIPAPAASEGQALAQSYETVGQNLVALGQTQNDTDFVAAIKTYDATADTFTKNYIALANLFGAWGVKFSSSDPGSVFNLSAPSGL